jgi:hypothetical protein
MKIGKNLALSDSGFVFNPSNGDSFSANPIGMEIIKMLKEGNTLSAIRASLLQQYEVDEPTVDRDCQDFVSTLSKFKLTEKDEKESN